MSEGTIAAFTDSGTHKVLKLSSLQYGVMVVITNDGAAMSRI